MKAKNIFGIAVILVFVTVLAISCDLDDDKNPFMGTWRSSEGYMAFFEDYSWEVPHYSGGVGLKGIYTHKDNTATITYQEITNNGIDWRSITSSEASGYTRTAKVSGNKLTWGVTTYTRQ
jgi:hypothetical protein